MCMRACMCVTDNDVTLYHQINHVIQFDFPTSVTDYLHRVGRTGRVGGTTHCQATTFMTKKSDIRMTLKIEVGSRVYYIGTHLGPC